MRVLQVNSVLGSGSTGRIASDICDVLKSDGEEGTVAFGRGTPVRGHFYFGDGASLCSHILATRVLDAHGLYSRVATQRLLRFISGWNPDVIHLHNIHGYYVCYPLLFEFLRRAGTPIVWTLHDCWALTGHCAFQLTGCEKWKSGCGRCPERMQYPRSWVCDNSTANLIAKQRAFGSMERLTIVTPSSWLAAQVKESCLAKFRTVIIHNGVDTSMFARYRTEPNPGGGFRLIAVASIWDERKGLQFLQPMMRNLPQDCILTVVGGLRKPLPASRRITHIPRTDSTEVLAALYAAADVLVNPTMADNFPMTIIEAMACGTPVVTFDTGGCSEALTPDTGVVVRRGDADGLAKAVMQIRERGKQWYTERCVTRARSAFNRIDRYRDYVQLYREVSFRG